MTVKIFNKLIKQKKVKSSFNLIDNLAWENNTNTISQ